ncbi:MAG TPA: DUF2141 domain-containing protein [Stellaceae bacterium]|nr:DUF2141 domain-containing protein [Stellaceae bacterium]
MVASPIVWVLSGLLLTLISAPAFAAPVRIEIQGVVKSAGTIHIALFHDAKSWDSEDADSTVQVPALPGTTVALLDLPPGDYAFFIYDDVNGNGKLDKTWVGFPDEPYAFSNNFRLQFSKPSFRDLKFTVSAQGAIQVIQLVEP